MVPLELVMRDGDPASLARASPGSCRWIQRVRNKLGESSNESSKPARGDWPAGMQDIRKYPY